MSLKTLSPSQVSEKLKQGALLVDIREIDEINREKIEGALCASLSTIRNMPLPNKQLIFTCRSGMRTESNARLLASLSSEENYILEGGLNAWVKAGFKTQKQDKAPIEISRQVQLIAGSFIALGAFLSFTLHPSFAALSLIMGLGLMFAGATGWCGMAKVLKLLPYNKA